MHPKRSFIPKIAIEQIAKNFKKKEESPEKHKLSSERIAEENQQILILKKVIPEKGSCDKPQETTPQKDLNISMELDFNYILDLNRQIKEEKQLSLTQLPNIITNQQGQQQSILDKPFFRKKIPNLNITSEDTQDLNLTYLKIQQISYQAELDRFHRYYKDHPKYVQLIETYAQHVKEYFDKELRLKQEHSYNRSVRPEQIKEYQKMETKAIKQEGSRLIHMLDNVNNKIDLTIPLSERLDIILKIKQHYQKLYENSIDELLPNDQVQQKTLQTQQLKMQIYKKIINDKENQIQKKFMLLEKLKSQQRSIQSQIDQIEIYFGQQLIDDQVYTQSQVLTI